MPLRNRTTLTQYLIEERRRFPGSSGDFNSLILDVAKGGFCEVRRFWRKVYAVLN